MSFNPRLILPSIELLKEYFIYDEANGNLIWKKCRRSRNLEGEIAGYTDSSGFGYKLVGFHNKRYLLHRLIWKMHTGDEPPYEIDHKDTNPANNKFSNLREATRNDNLANSRLSFANTSGYKGVSVHKKTGLWRARITINYKDITIGYFKTIEEAAKARKLYSEKISGEFARNP